MTSENLHHYPPPPTHGPAPPSRIPRVAKVSLVFGLLAFFTMFIFIGTFPAIIAVITGHVAISRIRHSSGRFDGYGVAMTGVVLGYITLVGISILMLLVLFFYQPVNRYLNQYRQQQSMHNGSSLYLAAEAYARDHRGAYPKNWKDLEGRYMHAPKLKNCLQSVYSFRKSGEPAFHLVPHQRPVLPAVSAQVVVIQEIAQPGIDLITVVYADGNTELIANPNRNSGP